VHSGFPQNFKTYKQTLHKHNEEGTSVVCGDTFDQKTSAAEVDLATIQGRGS